MGLHGGCARGWKGLSGYPSPGDWACLLEAMSQERRGLDFG